MENENMSRRKVVVMGGSSNVGHMPGILAGAILEAIMGKPKTSEDRNNKKLSDDCKDCKALGICSGKYDLVDKEEPTVVATMTEEEKLAFKGLEDQAEGLAQLYKKRSELFREIQEAEDKLSADRDKFWGDIKVFHKLEGSFHLNAKDMTIETINK